MRVSAWLYLIQQLLCSTCLLICIGQSAGLRRMAPWRIGAMALLMTMLTMYAQGLAAPLRLLLLPVAALSPLAAWPDAPRHVRLRMLLPGLLTPLTLAGLLRLPSGLPLPWYMTLLPGCGALLLLARAGSRRPPLPPCTTVEVTLGPRRAVLTALVDSGNLLCDSLTSLPVIVISRRAAHLLRLPQDGALLPGMRLMPVRTVSGVTMMTILRPDALRIRVGGAWQSAAALIGLSPAGGEGFQALVPAGLLPCTPAEIPRRAISQ